jgi:hypothetical protein
MSYEEGHQDIEELERLRESVKGIEIGEDSSGEEEEDGLEEEQFDPEDNMLPSNILTSDAPKVPPTHNANVRVPDKGQTSDFDLEELSLKAPKPSTVATRDKNVVKESEEQKASPSPERSEIGAHLSPIRHVGSAPPVSIVKKDGVVRPPARGPNRGGPARPQAPPARQPPKHPVPSQTLDVPTENLEIEERKKSNQGTEKDFLDENMSSNLSEIRGGRQSRPGGDGDNTFLSQAGDILSRLNEHQPNSYPHTVPETNELSQTIRDFPKLTNDIPQNASELFKDDNLKFVRIHDSSPLKDQTDRILDDLDTAVLQQQPNGNNSSMGEGETDSPNFDFGSISPEKVNPYKSVSPHFGGNLSKQISIIPKKDDTLDIIGSNEIIRDTIDQLESQQTKPKGVESGPSDQFEPVNEGLFDSINMSAKENQNQPAEVGSENTSFGSTNSPPKPGPPKMPPSKFAPPTRPGPPGRPPARTPPAPKVALPKVTGPIQDESKVIMDIVAPFDVADIKHPTDSQPKEAKKDEVEESRVLMDMVAPFDAKDIKHPHTGKHHHKHHPHHKADEKKVDESKVLMDMVAPFDVEDIKHPTNKKHHHHDHGHHEAKQPPLGKFSLNPNDDIMGLDLNDDPMSNVQPPTKDPQASTTGLMTDSIRDELNRERFMDSQMNEVSSTIPAPELPSTATFSNVLPQEPESSRSQQNSILLLIT